MNIVQVNSEEDARQQCDFETVCVVQVGSGSAIFSKSQHLIDLVIRAVHECGQGEEDGEIWLARLPRRRVGAVLRVSAKMSTAPS